MYSQLQKIVPRLKISSPNNFGMERVIWVVCFVTYKNSHFLKLQETVDKSLVYRFQSYSERKFYNWVQTFGADYTEEKQLGTLEKMQNIWNIPH